jgi:hypothetical protein
VPKVRSLPYKASHAWSNRLLSAGASVSGVVGNMMPKEQYLDYTAVSDGPANFSISSFSFNNEDSLTFRLEVTVPETGKKNETMRQQTFW